MRFHPLLAKLLVLTFVAPSLGGSVLHVDDAAPPGGDGSAWQSALRFLQDALVQAAQPRSDVSEIRVAGGTYRPDRDQAHPAGSGERAATFELVEAVAVRGGYLGLAAREGEDPDGRDLQRHATILSGDLAGNDGPDFAGGEENSYHVVFAEALGPATVLDGVTITGGFADGPAEQLHERGAGMLVLDGAPTLLQCTFVANRASTTQGFRSRGGGLCNQNSSTAVLDCTFIGNRAEGSYFYGWGGAVCNIAGSPTIAGCTFSANMAGQGGAIHNREGSTPTIVECDFVDNVVLEECVAFGGAIHVDTGSALVEQCTFAGNGASSDNCADFASGGAVCTTAAHVEVIACAFQGNSAAYGGAIFSGAYVMGTIAIADCTFTGNDAASQGGAVASWGPGLAISGSTFTANTAGVGGGAVRSGSDGTISQCSFEGNSAPEGGAVYLIQYLEGQTFVNCQWIANTATLGGAIHATGRLVTIGGQAADNAAMLGGGFYVRDGEVVLSGTSFIDNSASFGGGAYLDEVALVASGCLFDGNVADFDGGGLHLLTGPADVAQCEFYSNSAGGSGGGLYAVAIAHFSVRECDVFFNSCYHDGGGMYNIATEVTIDDSLFEKNYAWDSRGGAMYNFLTDAVVEHCEILDNHAAEGAGMVNELSDPSITRTAFRGNRAAYGDGGAMLNLQSSPLVVNCIFADNGAYVFHGSGMYNAGGSPTVVNSTFHANHTDAIFSAGSDTVVRNCIVWEHGAPIQGDPSEVTHSCIQGGHRGEGNIDADPRFVNSFGLNFKLLAGSPCIDAGNGADLPSGTVLDYHGLPRFVDDPATPDGGAGSPPIVDIGASEYQVGCVGDVNGDGAVGTQDLVDVILGWGAGGGDADVNQDGAVDDVDLVILLAWGPCPDR